MRDTKLKLHNYQNTDELETVRNYANKRYFRWLDYSKYHCTLAGIIDEANDVLNETLASLFSKDGNFLIRLYRTKKSQYSELDFYVLRMIKLNSYSPTSPYKSKYKQPVKIDYDADFSRLEIEDEPDHEPDRAGETLRQYRLVKYIADGLDLTDKERQIFEFYFIHGMVYSQWPGPERSKMLYETFNMVTSVIHEILYFLKLTKVKPKVSGYNFSYRRKNELVERFLKTHKIHFNSYLNN